MKILKQGGTFKKTCKECGTEFEFTKEDIRVDYKDKPLVDCPTCGNEIFVNVKKF